MRPISAFLGRDATYGENTADYELDIDYRSEGSDPEIKLVNQVDKKVNSDTDYAKMGQPCQGTMQQRQMNSRIAERIEHVHQQGPEIMVLWLQDMYLWLGFSPEKASLLVREQGLHSPDRLRVLIDKNVDDICDIVMKPGGKNANEMSDRGQQLSVIAQENLKLAAFLFHRWWSATLIGKLQESVKIQCIC